jgi:hypothetical protein
MTESAIKTAIRLAHSVDDVRLFNNPVGECWQGAAYRQPDGSVVIRKPYRVTYGLAVGSGDLIGFRSVTVTPEMVGQRVAVFTSLEVKDKRGRKSYEQAAWLHMCRNFGAIAGVVRSEEETAALLAGDVL